jgi:hypothetical protein
MKKLVIIFTLAFSVNLMAKDKYLCQVILSGSDTYPDNLIIPEVANKKECEIAARKVLKENSRNYQKVSMFSMGRIVEVKPAETKN